MTEDIKQARETIRRCLALRDAGKVEAVLRSEFQSGLRAIFPKEDHQWIDHYVEGTEALTKIGKQDGKVANRFIDNLIGSTPIEFESDLRISTKRQEGMRQVQEQAAGLIRAGVPASQIRGILSDTVEWYVYDAELAPSVDPASCTPADVQLIPYEELQLSSDDESAAEQFVKFIRKHLAREQSRPLYAEFLAFDLGLSSRLSKLATTALQVIVEKGRANDPSIALATDLWSQFIDYLERNSSTFRSDVYVDEVYICILARLLSANILAERAILSNEAELKTILDGAYFKDHYQLENMVEQDYFGWLVRPAYIDQLVPIASEIQRDLYAYDFSQHYEDDIFGRLLAQLARRSQRKLLGQEWTPIWLAHLLAERCLSDLPAGEMPRIVDMCCGSGAIIAEVLKEAKKKFKLSDIAELQDVATGFDIDPLAVCLAKTTWVVALASNIKAAKAPIVIPIYHADSMFAITPVSASLPLIGEDEPIPVSLDGETIQLPHELVNPQYRELFDRIVDWAYDEALDAGKKGKVVQFSKQDTESFLTGAADALGIKLPAVLLQSLTDAIQSLANRMTDLAVNNRNGIWAFILRNTYRPGLLSGQFNGLVSNPPWLTMSGLADNPYRSGLTVRAKLYGIQPSGQSFLHLELGTMHLLHAIDRYLKVDASIACLVPGSVFNGHHHEPLRQRNFLNSKRPVAFGITEVWQVEQGTFKYPGAALIGHKYANSAGLKEKPIKGFLANKQGLEKVEFSVSAIGAKRSAWVLKNQSMPVSASPDAKIPVQGADLMPRTAVCVELLDNAEPECRVDTPKPDSQYGFSVKAAKELKKENFAGRVAKQFIYRMAQSENLLPFILGVHCVPVAIPAVKDANGNWEMYDTAEIRRMGFVQTARRFQAIDEKLKKVGKGKTLQERVNERAKLTRQSFGNDGYLVLSGAGGKHICAACVPVASSKDLIIDQTLYWGIVQSENEAWYQVGMLNSHAMTEAITPFNPRGDFSERHVHTLPYRLMPIFDPSNDEHLKIASLARELAVISNTIVSEDKYLSDPNRALAVRRRKLREQLCKAPTFQQLETLCAGALGTTAFGDDVETLEN